MPKKLEYLSSTEIIVLPPSISDITVDMQYGILEREMDYIGATYEILLKRAFEFKIQKQRNRKTPPGEIHAYYEASWRNAKNVSGFAKFLSTQDEAEFNVARGGA